MIKFETPIEWHVSFYVSPYLSSGRNVWASSPDEALKKALFFTEFDALNLLYIAPKNKNFTALADSSNNPENKK